MNARSRCPKDDGATGIEDASARSGMTSRRPADLSLASASMLASMSRATTDAPALAISREK
jgi:hypothetical protein